MQYLYLPSYSRIAPFAVGGILACNILLAKLQDRDAHERGSTELLSGQSIDKQIPTTSSTSFLVKLNRTVHYYWTHSLPWMASILSVYGLLFFFIPRSQPFSSGMQIFLSSAYRGLSCVALAVLLYRCLVPETHLWHWRSLNLILSHDVWKPISRIYFCSYLIHYRVMLELTLNPALRNLFNLHIPTATVDSSSGTVTFSYPVHLYVLKYFICTLLITLPLAYILHVVVEVPCNRWATAVVYPVSSSRAAEQNKDN